MISFCAFEFILKVGSGTEGRKIADLCKYTPFSGQKSADLAMPQ
jgi:hypothetical protein